MTSERQRFLNRRIIKRNHAKTKPCSVCAVQYNPWVMQFDHRDPLAKCFELHDIRKCSLQKIQAEIDKCDVVCANCHAERTYRQGHWLAASVRPA